MSYTLNKKNQENITKKNYPFYVFKPKKKLRLSLM